jgi:diacylglycerol kinase (ATP)
MNNHHSFIKNRIKSIGFAFKGTLHLLKKEASVQVQFVIGIILTIAGFYFELSTIESIEGINSAIEEIADFVHPDYHKKIGLIKDISAGAVFIFAVTAIIIGSIIYLPKIF